MLKKHDNFELVHMTGVFMFTNEFQQYDYQ